METTLLKALLNKGIVGPETEIEAHYFGVGIDKSTPVPGTGFFIIEKVETKGKIIILHLYSTKDGKQSSTTASDIISVDGMDPKRLALAYNISATGKKIDTGKKRGRKSKKDKERERLEAEKQNGKSNRNK